MKIFIYEPNGQLEQLLVKSVHFAKANREATREHAMAQHTTDMVWFEDEQPCDKLLDALAQEKQDEAIGNADPGTAN